MKTHKIKFVYLAKVQQMSTNKTRGVSEASPEFSEQQR